LRRFRLGAFRWSAGHENAIAFFRARPSPAHGLAAIMLPVAFFALLALAPSGAWAQAAVAPASGDGATTDTAYQITKLGNLAWLHDMAAASSTGSTYYKLMNDIDASATATWNDNGTTTTLVGFNPIGNVSDPFKGVFDGAGHKITGLVINRSSMDGVGLFGFIKSGGEASHLGLVGGSVTGNSYVGGLVGITTPAWSRRVTPPAR